MFRRLLQTDSHDYVATMLRLALGAVFFAHGAQKMLGWFGGFGYSGTMGAFTHMGLPAAMAFLIIFTEFFGSVSLLTGFLSRVASVGITFLMTGAILMVHRPNGFFMNWMGTQKGEGYEFHLLAIAIALAILMRGAGAISIDAAVAGRTRKEAAQRLETRDGMGQAA
jgi:putative oxidoreductase